MRVGGLDPRNSGRLVRVEDLQVGNYGFATIENPVVHLCKG
jgi:hypothetical protein